MLGVDQFLDFGAAGFGGGDAARQALGVGRGDRGRWAVSRVGHSSAETVNGSRIFHVPSTADEVGGVGLTVSTGS